MEFGPEQGLQFFAGYLLEKSLSVDNLFVFVLLFQAFAIPAQYQHRVLFWGVLGALLLRGSLILAGVALVHRFHWIIAIFGAVLVYTAVKIALHRDDEEERAPTDNAVVRLVRRNLPMTGTIEGPEFFVLRDGKRFATPLLLAVVAAETADLVFALDSIPAVFAVTDDSFIVFSSNICALLGLRALYFVVRGVLLRLRYLKPGLAAILLFVGLKMLLYKWVFLATGISLVIIAGILCVALVVSGSRRSDSCWRLHAVPRRDPWEFRVTPRRRFRNVAERTRTRAIRLVQTVSQSEALLELRQRSRAEPA
jgi:tellurite resistance protein TerC